MRWRSVRAVLFLALGMLAHAVGIGQYFQLPTLPPAAQYGNILINRTSQENKVKPVGFSHWSHRQRHTCRVCHLELNFGMKVNTTEISEKANQDGQYCGSAGCHDGKAAFGHSQENCDKCHSGQLQQGTKEFTRLKGFPKSRFGNLIDWNKALLAGLIKPKDHLISPRADMPLDSTFELQAEWVGIPPAIFAHAAHAPWLDCADCHPAVFNVEKKTTRHFSMAENLDGKFCGMCHLTVAFPLQDCKRCHPAIVM